jgi:hypothetical protein
MVLRDACSFLNSELSSHELTAFSLASPEAVTRLSEKGVWPAALRVLHCREDS